MDLSINVYFPICKHLFEFHYFMNEECWSDHDDDDDNNDY